MVKIRTEMNETGDVFLLIATSQMSIIILIITTQTHCMLCSNVCTLSNLEIQKLVTGEIGNNVYFYMLVLYLLGGRVEDKPYSPVLIFWAGNLF